MKKITLTTILGLSLISPHIFSEEKIIQNLNYSDLIKGIYSNGVIFSGNCYTTKIIKNEKAIFSDLIYDEIDTDNNNKLSQNELETHFSYLITKSISTCLNHYGNKTFKGEIKVLLKKVKKNHSKLFHLIKSYSPIII